MTHTLYIAFLVRLFLLLLFLSFLSFSPSKGQSLNSTGTLFSSTGTLLPQTFIGASAVSSSSSSKAASSPLVNGIAITLSLLVLCGFIAVGVISYLLNKQQHPHVAPPTSTPRPIMMLNRASNYLPPPPKGGRVYKQSRISAPDRLETTKLIGEAKHSAPVLPARPTKSLLSASLPLLNTSVAQRVKGIELKSIHIESLSQIDPSESSQQGMVQSTSQIEVQSKQVQPGLAVNRIQSACQASVPPIPLRHVKSLVSSPTPSSPRPSSHAPSSPLLSSPSSIFPRQPSSPSGQLPVRKALPPAPRIPPPQLSAQSSPKASRASP